jgi:perosamine synthetase
MTWRVPLARPDLSGNEARYALEAIESSWIGPVGPFVDRFEADFARVCGTSQALGVSNGTVGLHLAMAALGVGPGDEVIVPALTYIATANAVRYVGAEPVFVDVDPETWCIDPRAADAAVTPRTVGIIPVHLYGHPADMDQLLAIADRHGLFVVEDAAEAHGARYRDRPVGSLATAAVFSFYGNKIVTSGEGGAVTTSDPDLMAKLRLLRGQGMDLTRQYYFPVIGYNYRLTNVACALLCAQLERLDEMLDTRRRIDAVYREALRDVPGICLQPRAEWAEAVPWLVSVMVDEPEYGIGRDELMDRLAANGIETRPFFIPIHTLPPYTSGTPGPDLPVTTRMARYGVNLPTYSGLSPADVDYVIRCIAEEARHGD